MLTTSVNYGDKCTLTRGVGHTAPEDIVDHTLSLVEHEGMEKSQS